MNRLRISDAGVGIAAGTGVGVVIAAGVVKGLKIYFPLNQAVFGGWLSSTPGVRRACHSCYIDVVHIFILATHHM